VAFRTVPVIDPSHNRFDKLCGCWRARVRARARARVRARAALVSLELKQTHWQNKGFVAQAYNDVA